MAQPYRRRGHRRDELSPVRVEQLPVPIRVHRAARVRTVRVGLDEARIVILTKQQLRRPRRQPGPRTALEAVHFTAMIANAPRRRERGLDA
jgi:hypothetical protein